MQLLRSTVFLAHLLTALLGHARYLMPAGGLQTITESRAYSPSGLNVGGTLITQAQKPRGFYVKQGAAGCVTKEASGARGKGLVAYAKCFSQPPMNKGFPSDRCLQRQHGTCPALPVNQEGDIDASRVYIIEFYKPELPPAALHQGIFVAHLSRTPNILYHVQGNLMREKLQFTIRPGFDISQRPLSRYDLVGYIIPTTNLPAFEAAVRAEPRPGPGVVCGNCQRWTEKAIQRAVRSGALVPQGELS